MEFWFGETGASSSMIHSERTSYGYVESNQCPFLHSDAQSRAAAQVRVARYRAPQHGASRQSCGQHPGAGYAGQVGSHQRRSDGLGVALY